MSGLHDGILNASLVKYLQVLFPKLSDYSWKIRVKLVEILNDIYLDGGGTRIKGSREIENRGRISHWVYPSHCSLSAKWLESQFGPGVFNRIIEDLGCLEVIQEYQKGGWTKGYRLAKEWEGAFNDFYNESENNLTSYFRLVDHSGKVVRRPSTPNAIRSRDRNGNNPKTKAKIPFSIAVNQDCLRESFSYVKRINDLLQGGRLRINSVHKERLIRMYDDLWSLYHLSYSDFTPIGEIPQVYVEYESGRLFGRGISLQGSIREAKYAALAGRPLKELDMSNAHYTILDQLAQRCGIHCAGIESYLKEKKRFRKEITYNIYGEEIARGLISEEDAEGIIKECLIAPVNGAGTRGFESRWWEYTEGEYDTPDLITKLSFKGVFKGLEKAIRLERNELFKLVTDDIREAVSTVIESESLVKSRGGVWVYRNAMDKPINPDDKTSSQIISHLIRGVEAKILNIVLEEYEGKVYVPMHDGFTVDEDLDPREIEEKIKKKLGFSVEIKEEVKYRDVNLEVIKGRIRDRCFTGRRKEENRRRRLVG